VEYGLEWDRDHLVQLASTILHFLWPISVFIFQPINLFVLIFKTNMHRDCKIAFVVHDVLLVCFDIYNCYFYQIYTVLPYPVFCCTGYLCDDQTSHRLLFAILAFWTTAQCVPYLFVMMRMHQKMLLGDSPFKLSKSSQFLLMIVFSIVLVSNVYGFVAWSVESVERDEILENPSISWARNQSRNFLVFGKQYGDIGMFHREIYLLLFSIIICFSYYLIITYHVVFVIGKQAGPQPSGIEKYHIQLRFMIALSIQACVSSVMFILPLVALFLAMATPIAVIIPSAVLVPLRFLLAV
ncbi:hypothetical protein PENTCL1PPCAC_16004, partial [Pristionchus entomophagus]